MLPKKKILVFIDWYLPGFKAGGPIRSCANLIAHLEDDFEFFVVTRDTDYTEAEPYEQIKSNEWNTLPDGTKVYYISGSELKRRTLRKLICADDFDCFYINGIYSWYFSILPLLLLRKHKHVVVAARGMFAPGAVSVKKIKKVFFLATAKALGLYNKVVFHATTNNEKAEIRKRVGERAVVRVAPNLPKKYGDITQAERSKHKGNAHFINIARIAPEKNLKFAFELLSEVKGRATFDIYGPVYNQKYWDECKLQLQNLRPGITVNYKGSIENEKIPELLEDYHFMLMPTLGENFGHIILESLAAACPVIISDQTPWKNLADKKAGWDIPLADAGSFVAQIESCIAMRQEEYDQYSNGAFEFAQRFINDPELAAQNRRLFSDNQ